MLLPNLPFLSRSKAVAKDLSTETAELIEQAALSLDASGPSRKSRRIMPVLIVALSGAAAGGLVMLIADAGKDFLAPADQLSVVHVPAPTTDEKPTEIAAVEVGEPVAVLNPTNDIEPILVAPPKTIDSKSEADANAAVVAAVVRTVPKPTPELPTPTLEPAANIAPPLPESVTIVEAVPTPAPNPVTVVEVAAPLTEWPVIGVIELKATTVATANVAPDVTIDAPAADDTLTFVSPAETPTIPAVIEIAAAPAQPTATEPEQAPTPALSTVTSAPQPQTAAEPAAVVDAPIATPILDAAATPPPAPAPPIETAALAEPTQVAPPAPVTATPVADPVIDTACVADLQSKAKKLRVMFSLSSSAISANYKKAIGEFAAAAGKCSAAKVEVAGHADTADSASKDLSLKRAEEVRRLLTSAGLEEARVKATGYGTRDLAVKVKAPKVASASSTALTEINSMQFGPVGGGGSATSGVTPAQARRIIVERGAPNRRVEIKVKQ